MAKSNPRVVRHKRDPLVAISVSVDDELDISTLREIALIAFDEQCNAIGYYEAIIKRDKEYKYKKNPLLRPFSVVADDVMAFFESITHKDLVVDSIRIRLVGFGLHKHYQHLHYLLGDLFYDFIFPAVIDVSTLEEFKYETSDRAYTEAGPLAFARRIGVPFELNSATNLQYADLYRRMYRELVANGTHAVYPVVR